MADLRPKVLPVLRRLGGRATAGDVAAGAGLPLQDVTQELWRLVGDLNGHVDVDDKGEFLFKFPPSLRRPTDPERRAAFWRALYAGFKFIFKLCILAVLALYTLVFAALALLLALAALAAAMKGDHDSEDSGSWGLEGLFHGLFVVADSTPRYSRWERNRGLSYREAAPKPRRRPWEAVFAFVFGEEGPPREPRDRAVMAYVREQRGVLGTADLVALTGADMDEAGRLAGQLSARYGGSVELTSQGSLLYRFEQLAVTAGKGAAGGWSYCWDDVEAPLPATGNGPGTNLLIGGVNAFNLAWSGWFALSPTGLQDALGYIAVNLFETSVPDLGPAPRLALGWAPFLFSATFFAVPALRLLFVAAENRRREARNLWRRVTERVFRHSVWRDGKPITATAMEGLPEPPRRLEEAARAWRGVTIPGFGEEGYLFPRLRQETEDARDARKGVPVARLRIGRVVFATEAQPNIV